jgi:hypothetical protein
MAARSRQQRKSGSRPGRALRDFAYFLFRLVDLRRFFKGLSGEPPELRYFDYVLRVERRAIARRRAHFKLRALKDRPPRPNGPMPRPDDTVDPKDPDLERMRPRPIPNTAVGLALSGGGVRSAAFALGAIQALDDHELTRQIDYLSTVSGGGYIGASMTAAMSCNNGEFPFNRPPRRGGGRTGRRDRADIRDNDAVAQLRNYSNYLMPRARSSLRNASDVAVILLRGLLANAFAVIPFLVGAALLTATLYPRAANLLEGNFFPHLFTWLVKSAGAFVDWIRGFARIDSGSSERLGHLEKTGLDGSGAVPGRMEMALRDLWQPIQNTLADCCGMLGEAGATFATKVGNTPFWFTAVLAAVLAVVLLYWVLLRSMIEATDRDPDDPSKADRRKGQRNDANSEYLRWARRLLGATLISFLLDVQPLLIHFFGHIKFGNYVGYVTPALLLGAAVTFAGFAQKIGAFLETTKLSAKLLVRLARAATQIAIIFLGLILPLALLAASWVLAIWLMDGFNWAIAPREQLWPAYQLIFVVTLLISFSFEANSYSLHQFYKDRLGKAFLFDPSQRKTEREKEYPPLWGFKLSELNTGLAPYHIINAALNVQGSREANRRGRDADFFTFTPDFVGSDLTHFAPTFVPRVGRSNAGRAPTRSMQEIDPSLDLGGTMAISGAAVSANMGSQTIRWLSPTLALLNIRLGYWMRNPRYLAKQQRVVQVKEKLRSRLLGSLYLLGEMLNLITEDSPFVFLSDGGHIENLGIYQLLKRGCRLIIAIDAEADPELSCSSLLKLERYARIDLGVRIILPWEEIARRGREIDKAIDPATPEDASRQHGPHCAIGRILYEDGTRGVLLYFKSSLSGDEKDYVLDYKKRNMDFPHETTSDQFFTEEQFEVYRSLGYHVVEGYFSNTDKFAWKIDRRKGWRSPTAAKAEVRAALWAARR